jgi:heptosyltransferase-2
VRCGECVEYDPLAERILIVKLGAMGDVLRTTSCLAPLKARHPRSHITWVTRPSSRALLADNPSIDRVLTIDANYLELLLAEEFDVAIGPEADVFSASIMRLARASEKRGFVADGRGGVNPLGPAALAWWHTGIDDALKRSNRRTYGEWLYEVCTLPTPVAPPSLTVGAAARARIAAFLTRRVGSDLRLVCVNTGASSRWREKRWKAAHYRDLARLVRHEEPDSAMILVGGPEEAAFNRELLASDAGFIDGGVDRSVEELAALMAACDWVLTPDSLGYHVACAVGTPAVCLVGPTSPWELDRYGVNLVLHGDLPCIACYRAECPLPRTCMDVLTPAVVWAHVSAWCAALSGSRDADRVARAPIDVAAALVATTPPQHSRRTLPLAPARPSSPSPASVPTPP